MVKIHCSSSRSDRCCLLSKSRESLCFSAFYCLAVLLVQRSCCGDRVGTVGRERAPPAAGAMGNVGCQGEAQACAQNTAKPTPEQWPSCHLGFLGPIIYELDFC